MRIHLLGIGGAGLSALAGWLHDQGHQISGCDLAFNQRLGPLLKKGTKIEKGNDITHISSSLDWLIHPNIDPSHPEIQAAKDKGIPTSTYFQALGKITADYKTIAVSGAHGKTTTTLMIKTILEKLGADPNVIVGEGIYRSGDSNLFVVEACEYKRQFLSLQPDILIITNIAHDHPDCYQDINQVEEAFLKLISQMQPGSTVIGFSKDQRVKKLLNKARQKNLTPLPYGSQLKAFQPEGWGSSSKLKFNNQTINLHLSIPGQHNVYNALAALKVAQALKLPLAKAASALSDFSGPPRRQEKIAQIGKAVLIDDYAHHPQQIAATLKSLRDVYPHSRLVAVFEPHQYERTWQLFDRFTQVWNKVDQLYLTPIYKVKGRESKKALQNTSSQKLAAAIKKQGVKVEFVPQKEKLLGKLEKEGQNSTAIIIFSAGPLSNFLRDSYV